jgi:hypothetical protein
VPSHFILTDVPGQGLASSDIQEGTSCLIQYLCEGVIHSFRSEVLGIIELFHLTKLLGLQYPNQVKSQNLRSFPRVKIQLPAQLFEPGGGGLTCVILDISQGGCRADIPLPSLKPGDLIRLSFTLPNSALTGVPCEVKRTSGANQYGLEFKDLSGDNKTAVEKFLSGFGIFHPLSGRGTFTQGMVGNIEEVSLPDLLQILANSRRPYQLDFASDSDWAKVYVREGEVIHARTSNCRGADAIFELISWTGGRYQIQIAEWFPPRNVRATVEHLLLEYVYRQDHNYTEGDVTSSDSKVKG